MLEIKNLHVSVGEKPILKGLSLSVPKGQVHAIMGPNGSGKSTLGYALAGRDGYEVTEGEILWNGENLLDMEPEERAAAGVFLAFQYPMEIPGVATMTFLRTALNSVRKQRGEDELSTPAFMKVVKQKAKTLGVKDDMLKRALNVGFSEVGLKDSNIRGVGGGNLPMPGVVFPRPVVRHFPVPIGVAARRQRWSCVGP